MLHARYEMFAGYNLHASLRLSAAVAVLPPDRSRANCASTDRSRLSVQPNVLPIAFETLPPRPSRAMAS
jgi:hypothetical protein